VSSSSCGSGVEELTGGDPGVEVVRRSDEGCRGSQGWAGHRLRYGNVALMGRRWGSRPMLRRRGSTSTGCRAGRHEVLSASSSSAMARRAAGWRDHGRLPGSERGGEGALRALRRVAAALRPATPIRLGSTLVERIEGSVSNVSASRLPARQAGARAVPARLASFGMILPLVSGRNDIWACRLPARSGGRDMAVDLGTANTLVYGTRPRHRPLGALGGVAIDSQTAGPRGRRRSEADARPHARHIPRSGR